MKAKLNIYRSKCCAMKTAIISSITPLTLGRRRAIAGVEYALVGMKRGGYRKVRVNPHLAYRDQGVDGLVPANAVLIVELWLREILHGG